MEYSVYHKLSNKFMFDTIFRFDNIWGSSKKYLIKSEKFIFLFHFAQNTSLNKF